MPEFYFTAHEQKVIQELLAPGVGTETIIPQSSHLELWDRLAIACKGFKKADETAMKLRLVIGHLLRVIQENPKFYTDRGYDGFEHFLKDGVEEKMHFSRTRSYQAMRLAEKFPTLTPDRFAAIGPPKLSLLATFTDETQPSCEVHLQAAESKTLTQLREYAEEGGWINPGEGTPSAIVIHTSLEIRRVWDDFCHNAGVIGTCGDDKGRILLAMIQECSSEWFSNEPQVEVVPT